MTWATLEELESSPGTGKRVVLVAVGALDRRAVVAAEQAHRIPAGDRRAVHVATDPRVAEKLALRWPELLPGGPPLDVIADAGGVAATIAAETRLCQVTDADEVVVLIGQLAMAGVGRVLLHDQTATAVCEAVNRVPGARAVLIPVNIDADG